MHFTYFFVLACLIGSIACAIHKRETDEETSATTGQKGSGSPSFPDIGAWWTDLGKEYGPEKWTNEAQNWFNNAPSWLQFGKKQE